MSAYCELADHYDYGVPAGGIPNPGRVLSASNATTNLFTVDNHGFRSNAELTFRAEAGGALPTGISEGTTYYAIPVTERTFRVSASSGPGAAVDFTTAGSNILVVGGIPSDAAIEWASSLVEDYLPAHVVPLTAP